MARFLTLIRLTDQGMREISQSPRRAEAFRSAVEAAGGKVEGLFWSMGRYDGAVIFQAADEKKAAKLLIDLGRAGNVQTETLELFDADELQQLMGG